ncbi:hypothetical protein AB0M36_35335 [Actinoplanes sp. NPDC051346]|uniref:hypothetical protein n=1 Tax=Actinoplanes sp. NPDC051346 TaxID=3155048 RepID=UPI00342C8527
MGVRGAATGGVVCGLVTAGAIGVALGSLEEYQVPDFADTDGTVGLLFSVLAAVVAAAVIAVVRVIAGRSGARWPKTHVVLPVVLVPVAVVPLVTGAERNRLEAGLIWGAAAVAVQVLVAYSGSGDRWRRWMAAGLVLPCAAAALATWGCQTRWRAQKFEAVGLPLYVPEVPGYRLTGTWAGRYSVSMALVGPSGRELFAVIGRTPGREVDCASRGGRPWRESAAGQGKQRALCCLRDGAVLELVPGVAGPLPDFTVREVDGATLAGHPDDPTMSEPD